MQELVALDLSLLLREKQDESEGLQGNMLSGPRKVVGVEILICAILGIGTFVAMARRLWHWPCGSKNMCGPCWRAPSDARLSGVTMQWMDFALERRRKRNLGGEFTGTWAVLSGILWQVQPPKR